MNEAALQLQVPPWLQIQLRRWCEQQGLYLQTAQAPSSLYALPNGSTTADRAEAREQWELYQLQRNAVKCPCALYRREGI